MALKQLIEQRTQSAFEKAGIEPAFPIRLQWSGKPEFGDMQINGVMAAAKAARCNPRELASQVLEQLELDDIADKLEIAGPGFINIHLASSALASAATSMAADPHLGVPKTTEPQSVVVDYSAPNLAKEMHVGHLRSTIIGDAMCRILEFRGDRVIRQNHIGDWGTQFGMLIAELDEQFSQQEIDQGISLSDLEAFYRQAKQHFDQDADFADRARRKVVELQSGDTQCLLLWQRFIEASLEHAESIYRKLNVTLTRADAMGESAYNEDLQPLVAELVEKGIAERDQGALVVKLQELADKEGNASVAIIQKADGGYLYATTDLAALRYRASRLKADRCLYFIDARQSLHMKQVFAIARRAGWVGEQLELTHCAFGTMMGADGKPFKTRSGETIKLAQLLDEAVQRAADLVQQKNPELDAQQRDLVAQRVGIGAVKYADLSKARTNDYRFNWDSMLSFEGNTAPYLLYAVTRIHSLFRKAGLLAAPAEAQIQVEHQAEKDLVLCLERFAEVLDQVSQSAMPHELCAYLYDLAGRFTNFYENCPVLRSDVPQPQRESRLALADLTRRTLQTGLELLGIDCLEFM